MECKIKIQCNVEFSFKHGLTRIQFSFVREIDCYVTIRIV